MEAASGENLRIERSDDGVVTVSINRPDVLNALNDATIGELESCFHALRDDAEARAVIVTGAGNKAFAAGADIRELAEQGVAEARRRSQRGQRAMLAVEQLGKPVLAAINGYALGGGCELALACHLRYAARGAKLGLPEVGLGIIPGYGGTQRLQRLVGVGPALEWILTGGMFSAEEALRVGVVNGVFAPEGLLPEVGKIARQIVARGPLALRSGLEAVLRGRDVFLAEGLRVEADLFGLLGATADMREGLAAFLEKRPPRFSGE